VLGKKVTVMAFVECLLVWHSAKKVPMGPHDRLFAESHKLALGKASFLAECLHTWHSAKGASVGPFARLYA
jgi:hypothetical protein